MLNDQTRFIIFALGIFLCYFCFGILQEKITRGRYGEEKNEDGTIGERFTYSLALVWIQCICNWIFAKGMAIMRSEKVDTTHTGYYASSSLTYLLAMIGSTMALRWVSYPTQVVAKSAKPIPVMILGVLIGRKTYSYVRYCCVFTIVVGVILFMYNEGKVGPVNNQDKTSLGELLLFLSLAMDGLTGAIQDRLRADSAPSGPQMMLAMNWWSSIMLCPAILLTGEIQEFSSFALRHPNVLIDLLLISLNSAIGQLFIFLMVSGFGALACSVVTTTRKFFTVLCSVILFGNVLIARQWFGAILVFTGLFADMIYGKKSLNKTVSPKHEDDKKKLLS